MSAVIIRTQLGAHLMTPALSLIRCVTSVAPSGSPQTSSHVPFAEKASTLTAFNYYQLAVTMMTPHLWCLQRKRIKPWLPSFSPIGNVLTVNSAIYAPLPLRRHIYFTVMYAIRLFTRSAGHHNWSLFQNVNGNVLNVSSAISAGPISSLIPNCTWSLELTSFKIILCSLAKMTSSFLKTSLFAMSVGWMSTRNHSVKYVSLAI